MALAKVCQKTDFTMKAVHLDNCGVDDEECAALLQGLVHCNEFRTFYYKNNVFGEESLSSMQQIFQKPRPSALLNLRLVNCKTIPAVLTQLLEVISYQAIFLRSLGLIEMGVN